MGWSFMSEETAANVNSRNGADKNSRRTHVVRAHLERLIAAHHQADLLGLLVLEEAHVAGAALLPLRGVGRETEELRAPVGVSGGGARGGEGRGERAARVGIAVARRGGEIVRTS